MEKTLTLKEFEAFMGERMKELDKNPPIFEDSPYGRHIRATLRKLS